MRVTVDDVPMILAGERPMKNLTRRALVHSAAALAAGLLLPRTSSVARAQSTIPWSVIGWSQVGEPLIVYHLGDGPTRVFLLGGQHGGPEENTTRLVRLLVEHFTENWEEVPAGVGLDFMPLGNPDGMAAGSRQYRSGVDPNRNWGGRDWRTDAYDSNGRYVSGLGGPAAFSEQETEALADWLQQASPALVINYHSAGGFMFGGREGRAGEYAEAYADASGYRWPVPGQGSSPLPYRASGSMNVWMREIGIAGIFVELATPYETEFRRNLAGLRAAIAVLA